MKLLIDIGNTRVKWACSRDGVLRESGESLHRDRSPADAARWVATLTEKPAQVCAANVGGSEVETALRSALQSHWGVEMRCITAR